MSDADQLVAELSKLRAFALRVGPIVKAALELRELGRSLESVEKEMDRRDGLDFGTRCATPWLILNQAYNTALQEFDAKVKKAALGDFVEFFGDTYEIFDREPGAKAKGARPL